MLQLRLTNLVQKMINQLANVPISQYADDKCERMLRSKCNDCMYIYSIPKKYFKLNCHQPSNTFYYSIIQSFSHSFINFVANL